MKTGIAVIAYNRPRYLYICLDALYQVAGIEDFDVTVYFDSGLDTDMRKQQEDVLNFFPSAKSYFHEGAQPTKILKSVTRALSMSCLDHDEVFYLEDDHLVRPDILKAIASLEKRGFFVCMAGGRSYSSSDYRAKGNIISRENFDILQKWIARGGYYGVTDRGGGILSESTTSHDAVYCTFLREHGEKTQFVNGFYVAHFGLFGANVPKANACDEALAIDKLMFQGAPEKWLHNTARILIQGSYSDGLRLLLWPRGFIYNTDQPLSDSHPARKRV